MTEAELIEAYQRKLASNTEREHVYQTLQITCSWLTQPYYIVLGTNEITTKLETGETITWTPSAADFKNAANNGDMDQNASFTLPDVGNILDDEIMRRPAGDAEVPLFTFRAYLDVDLDYPADGPVSYDLISLTQSKGVFTANTGVPKLNQKSTGVLATTDVFPPMRWILA